MTRRLWVEFAIVAAMAATFLLVARGVPRRSEALAAPAAPPQGALPNVDDAMAQLEKILPQLAPNRTGPNWKQLSPDVGLQLRDDAYYGLRARLWVRVDGRWTSVGIDSPSDIALIVPAR